MVHCRHTELHSHISYEELAALHSTCGVLWQRSTRHPGTTYTLVTLCHTRTTIGCWTTYMCSTTCWSGYIIQFQSKAWDQAKSKTCSILNKNQYQEVRETYFDFMRYQIKALHLEAHCLLMALAYFHVSAFLQFLFSISPTTLTSCPLLFLIFRL
jgi:hypothetical protein